jgi:DNA-binding XRE family transcriptional regulator
MNCNKCFELIEDDKYTQVGIGGLREYYHNSCYKEYVMASAILPIGKAIKLVRIEKGVRQKDLAVNIGISVNYLSLIENDRRVPTLGVLIAISQFLVVTLSYIIKKAEDLEDN